MKLNKKDWAIVCLLVAIFILITTFLVLLGSPNLQKFYLIDLESGKPISSEYVKVTYIHEYCENPLRCPGYMFNPFGINDPKTYLFEGFTDERGAIPVPANYIERFNSSYGSTGQAKKAYHSRIWVNGAEPDRPYEIQMRGANLTYLKGVKYLDK